MKKGSKKFDQDLFDADIAFYSKIWDDRLHKSDLTGNYLGTELQVIFFHHLLPKEIYPQYRHSSWNILLVESKLHHQIETNPHLLPKEVHDRYYEILKETTDRIK